MAIEEDSLARSQRFKALFDDPTMRELTEGTLGDLFREWVKTEPFDTQGRERIYQTALAVRCLSQRLAVETEPAERAEVERKLAAEEQQRAIQAEQERRERGAA